MDGERRSYTAESKMEALRLLETSGKSASEIERELGIGDGCLRQWRKRLEADGGGAFPGHGRVSADQEELVRLKRELEVVRQERDIPKRSSGHLRPGRNRASALDLPSNSAPPKNHSLHDLVQEAGHASNAPVPHPANSRCSL